MDLSAAIQEGLLCILCFQDGKLGASYVNSLVPYSSYDPYFREIAQAASKYLAQYKKAPGEHTMDLIDALKKKNPDSKSTYTDLFRSMLGTKDVINTDYILSQALAFRKFQRCKSITARALEELNTGTEQCVEAAEAILSSVTKPLDAVNILDRGLLLNDPKQALQFFNQDEVAGFPIGIKEFDKIGVQPFRGGSFLYLGAGNSGKTHFCVHAGKNALMARAKVLHISLEMSAAKVAQRYIQSLFSVTRREAQQIVTHHFNCDRSGRFTGLERVKVKDRPSLKDKGIQDSLRKKIVKLLGHKPNLIIRGFPSGMLTIDMLNAFLDNLENTDKFIPDELIIDYPELMKWDPANARLEIGRLHVDLRGIAQKRNLALIHVSQSSVNGDNAKRLTRQHMAETKDKYNTADIVVAYNQTEAEEEKGLARLESIKVRDEERKTTVLISQAYAMGQYCLDSTMMSSNAYWSEIGGDEE